MSRQDQVQFLWTGWSVRARQTRWLGLSCITVSSWVLQKQSEEVESHMIRSVCHQVSGTAEAPNLWGESWTMPWAGGRLGEKQKEEKVGLPQNGVLTSEVFLVP